MKIRGSTAAKHSTRPWRAASVLLSCLAASVQANPSPDRPGASPPPATRTLAAGLSSPDGLAYHPVTGELHVVGETSGVVSVIRDGRAVPVLQPGFAVVDDLPAWAVTGHHPLSHWTHPSLRSPEGIAFSPDGKLYVAEDAPNGRVLEFTAGDDGQYRTARAIPIPWTQNAYAWESVAVARDGRIFVAGSAVEGGPGVFYGVVLMRDPAGDWWVVDYGPFSSFTGLALAANDDVLVVSEEIGGSVSWWDTIRHEEIGYTTDILPRAESVCVLPDGSILAAQESTVPYGEALASAAAGAGPRGHGRVVRIHPESAAVTEVAAGFADLESIVINPATGALVVSEDGSGRILELAEKPVADGPDLLARALHTREVTQGRGPRKWPAFIKDFFIALGVDPVDQDEPAAGADTVRKPLAPDERRTALTLEQFAEKVPFIAGRVKVVRAVGPVGPDPLDEVSFLMFYPNRTVRHPSGHTPSLSLFAAKHRSGRVVSTRELIGYSASTLRAGDASVPRQTGSGTLYLPLANGNVNIHGGATRLTLSFLGVDILDDYLMALNVGPRETGHLTLDLRRGGKEQYDVTFVEKAENGDLVRNLVVAGLEKSGSRNHGWYKLGSSSAPTLLSLLPGETPFETRRTAELVKMIQSRQQEWQLAMGLQPDQEGLQLSGKALLPTADSYAPQLLTVPTSVPAVANRVQPKPAGAGEQAERKEGEGRADTPADERQAEKPADDRHADKPGPDRQAKGDPRPSDETIILSRALEAWERKSAK